MEAQVAYRSSRAAAIGSDRLEMGGRRFNDPAESPGEKEEQ
jgi:hypothetical protein